MPASYFRSGQTSVGEVQWLAVEQPNDPTDGPDEARAGEAGPSHSFGPVEVVQHTRENVSEKVLGGAAALCIFGREIFALGSLQEIDFVERHTLLLGEADSGTCRRADGVITNRLRRPGHLTDYVCLPHRQTSRPQRQA